MEDLQQKKLEILRRLDIVEEAKAFGIEFTGSPPQTGWAECHGIGRADAKPSAAVCVDTASDSLGCYRDLGDPAQEKAISFFDLAMKAGKFASFGDALRHYASRAGVEMSNVKKPKPKKPAPAEKRSLVDQINFIKNPEQKQALFAEFACHKVGVSVESIKGTQCGVGWWPKNAPEGKSWKVLGFPGFRPGNWENPTAVILYRADGEPFPASEVGTLGDRKTHLLRGSVDSLVVVGTIEELAAAIAVWKCEGIPDALALSTHLPPGHIAVTNTHGAGSFALDLLSPFAGKVGYVVGDADDAGEAGAELWATNIARVASVAKSIVLPFEHTASHGKDLRDFLNEGGTIEQLMAIAKAAPAVAAAEQSSGGGVLDLLKRVLADGGGEALYQNRDLLKSIARLAVTDKQLFAAAKSIIRKVPLPTRDFDKAIKEYIAAAAAEVPPEHTRGDSGGFFEENSTICRTRLTADGPLTIEMSNFVARIVFETTRDDGAETTTVFGIEGQLKSGRKLPLIEVPAEKFAAVEWVVSLWGSDCIIWPAEARALPAAIQALSQTNPDVPASKIRKTVFTHTGWRKLDDGRWAYLHAGGAIGSTLSGVSVDLQLPLSRFHLPTPPTGEALKSAVLASIRLAISGVAPEGIMLPLLASVYRSVLGPCDFSVFILGKSGEKKSELSALCQQHFGPEFIRKNLPGGWSSTANSNERLAFLAKDALLVIDDFSPQGNASDVHRHHKDADRLFRAQGNNAGRQRMRHDGTLRKPTPPRGLILASGEDVPRGLSVQARLLMLELCKGAVDNDRLTTAQAQAASGLFASAMAGFLAWVAPQYDQIRERLPILVNKLRSEATVDGQHARAPTNIAEVAAGFRIFLDFAVEVGAINDLDRVALNASTWKALAAAAAAQSKHHETSDPASAFVQLLSSGLATGRFHLAGLDGRQPRVNPSAFGWRREHFGQDRNCFEPRSPRIGWVDEAGVYLDPATSFAEAQRLAGDQGDHFAVQPATLRRRLQEKNLLAATDKNRETLTVRKQIDGVRREVLFLRIDSLAPSEDDPTNLTTAESGRVSEGEWSGDCRVVSTTNETEFPEENPALVGLVGRSEINGGIDEMNNNFDDAGWQF